MTVKEVYELEEEVKLMQKDIKAAKHDMLDRIIERIGKHDLSMSHMHLTIRPTYVEVTFRSHEEV